MAGKEEAEGENNKRGNDWEVVSLTASAYAAAPGPTQVVLKDDDKEAQTSHPLYMSRHFDFPLSHLETIPTKPCELSEAFEDKDSGFSVEQETVSRGKEEGDLTLKGLDLSGLEYEQKETAHERTEPVTPSVVPDVNPSKDEKHEVAKVTPCEAWWKRSAACLISQAKEAKTVWSIFIAAAVMGIVILGQHWKRDKWQILQLNIANEKAARLIKG